MKISIDDIELFTLTEHHKDVIKNDVNADVCDDDLKRRLQWVLMHKYDQCFARLKKEWDKKLAQNEIDMIPTDPVAYANLVFSQPNYKDRKTRDLEEIL